MTSRPATATTLAAALAEDIRIAELKRLELQQQQQIEAEEQKKKLLDEQQRQQILLQGTDVGRDKSTHNGANTVVDVPAATAANPALILKPVIKTLLTPPSTTTTTTADTSPTKVQGSSSVSPSTLASNLTPDRARLGPFHSGADVRTDGGDSAAAAIVLLIDKLTATSIVRNGETRQTFRLWLSDGEISIQGLFRHGALDLLVDGMLFEGSYVQINEFEILQQPRLSGNGTVLILLASEAASVGHDGRNGLPAVIAAGVQKIEPLDESGVRLHDAENDEDDQDLSSPISKISPYYKLNLKPETVHTPTLPEGNDHVLTTAAEPAETETVSLIPSPTVHKQSTPSVTSTPTPTPRHKRKAQDILEVDDGSHQPLSQLDANQRPGSRGWVRKKQRLQNQMSPEKALKFHSDAFLEQLKAIQASPSKVKHSTDAQTTLSPTKEGVIVSKSSPMSSQNSAGTVPFSPSPKKTKSQEARRQQRLSEVFSPSKVKKAPAKKPSVKLNSKAAGMISSLPNPAVASGASPHPQRNAAVNMPPSAQRPGSSLEAPRPKSSASTPKPPKPIARPVKLTPLSGMTGSNACRSKIIDVLVVISHVNPRLLVRSGFPNSRELLVMDCSTTKQVHLTVFVDAAYFNPAPGTIALMRNITTHEYGGGSLKAYFQRCVGVQWFIQEGEIDKGWQPGEWDDKADDLRKFWLENDDARTVPEGSWWTEKGAARFQRSAQ